MSYAKYANAHRIQYDLDGLAGELRTKSEAIPAIDVVRMPGVGSAGNSSFLKGAVSAVSNNLVNQGAQRLMGVETSFSWKSIAASAVSGGIGATVAPHLGKALGDYAATENGQSLIDFTSGAVGGIVSLHARRQLGMGDDVNYGTIFGDAFGAMLGNRLAGQHRLAAAEVKAAQQLLSHDALMSWNSAPAEDPYAAFAPGGQYSTIGRNYLDLADWKPSSAVDGASLQPLTHVVQPGESLSRVAGTSDPKVIGLIMALNGLKSTLLQPGQELNLGSLVGYSDDQVGALQALGQAALDGDNARLAMLRERAAPVSRTDQLAQGIGWGIYQLPGGHGGSGGGGASAPSGTGARSPQAAAGGVAYNSFARWYNDTGDKVWAWFDSTALGQSMQGGTLRNYAEGERLRFPLYTGQDLGSEFSRAVLPVAYEMSVRGREGSWGDAISGYYKGWGNNLINFYNGTVGSSVAADLYRAATGRPGQFAPIALADTELSGGALAEFNFAVVGTILGARVAPRAGGGADAVVANTQRAELIAEANSRSAYLRGKFGSLTSEQRLARIDELSQANWTRRVDEMINSQDYVFRYLTESGLQASLKYNSVRGYATTNFSSSGSEIMSGAQIFEQWPGAPYTGPVKYRVAIPVNRLQGFSVARPMGGAGTTGWEVFANSYPAAGAGGYSQFLINPVPLNQTYLFTLRP